MQTRRDTPSILPWLRVADIPKLARRAVGLPYLSRRDFFPDVSAQDVQRLPALARAARGDGPRPIIVLGVMPRSGTNFIRDLLALHPDITADPGRLYEFPLLQVAGGARALSDEFLASFPRNAEVVGRWDLLATLAGGWLRSLQSEAGPDQRVLLKCPHVLNLRLAPLIFPDADILLCMRDGRDVVDSSLATFGSRKLFSKSFRQLTDEWRLSAQAVLELLEDQDLPNVHLVRFEDLVSDEAGTLQALFAATGLSPSAYDFGLADDLPVRGSSRAKESGGSRWVGQQKTDTFNPVARWKSWPKKRLARFDVLAGNILEAAGYVRDA